MTSPMLSITNHHLVAYGVPPDFQIGERDYVGYFENELGEQWCSSTAATTERGGCGAGTWAGTTKRK